MLDSISTNVSNITQITQKSYIPLIEANGLGKTVGLVDAKIAILSDLSLTIAEGETVAIVGSSGSGKSTLLGILAGLDNPTDGQVLIKGQPFSALDEDSRARVRGLEMGFVFQSFQLLPTMTALENVMLPMQLQGLADAEPIAMQTLASVGLQHRVSHYPKQLSGGEQQRVAIARAFANQPAILFADEPTGNLDNETGKSIIELLFKLNADAKTTLVLVTHDRQLASQCARTLTLKQGQLVEVDA
jgi:putative ABC transport system ATP-binding protein